MMLALMIAIPAVLYVMVGCFFGARHYYKNHSSYHDDGYCDCTFMAGWVGLMWLFILVGLALAAPGIKAARYAHNKPQRLRTKHDRELSRHQRQMELIAAQERCHEKALKVVQQYEH